MDPYSVPAFLPKLSEFQEMLIARCAVHVQLRHIRGIQYKYSGHVVTFNQNIHHICDTLPRLPHGSSSFGL